MIACVCLVDAKMFQLVSVKYSPLYVLPLNICSYLLFNYSLVAVPNYNYGFKLNDLSFENYALIKVGLFTTILFVSSAHNYIKEKKSIALEQ
jgi:hypothetical protein